MVMNRFEFFETFNRLSFLFIQDQINNNLYIIKYNQYLILRSFDCSMAFNDINPQGPVHILVIPKDKDGLNRLSSAKEHHKPLLV